ncbi:MAG: hypothetical protein ACM31C_05115, partial [Acidobacteriota bacterium]
DLLGVPAPHVTYYLYDGNVEGCRILAASGEVYDCAAGTTVYASVWPHYHELVHTVARPWGRPPAFLVEGLAEGLGGAYPRLLPGERAIAELALDSVDFYATNVAAHYQAAADFAIYLLRRFGAAKYRELSTSLLYLDDPATLERRFSEITGNRLDTTIAAWRTGDPLDGPPQPLDAARCNAPAADTPAPDTFTGGAADDCAVELAGPARLVRGTTFRTLDVTTPGLYQFSATIPAAGNVGFSLLGCNGSAASPLIDYNGPTTYALFALTAGRYSLETALYRKLADATPVDIGWNIASIGPAGATCETAAVFHAPASDWAVTLDSVPARDWPADTTGTPQTWLRIDGATAIDELAVFGATARVCGGPCDALASCQDLSEHQVIVSFPLAAGQALYVQLIASPGQTLDTYLSVRQGQNTMPIRGPNATARSRLPRSDWMPSTPYGSSTTWR